ncbi:sterol 14-demethylase [Aureococcus anophagefferens]|nr:sterol 14-demethylase [Aureococcus anophagefferens]
MLARLVASAVALGAAAATSDCSSCVERGDSVVKVITHGVWSNTFWTLFRAAAVQAAADPGVALDMELRETWDFGCHGGGDRRPRGRASGTRSETGGPRGAAAAYDAMGNAPAAARVAFVDHENGTNAGLLERFAGLASVAAAALATYALDGARRGARDDGARRRRRRRGGTCAFDFVVGAASTRRRRSSRPSRTRLLSGAAVGHFDATEAAFDDVEAASSRSPCRSRPGPRPTSRPTRGDPRVRGPPVGGADRSLFPTGPLVADAAALPTGRARSASTTYATCAEDRGGTVMGGCARTVAVVVAGVVPARRRTAGRRRRVLQQRLRAGVPVPGLLHHVGLPERETARDAAAHVLAAGGAARLYCVVEAADRDTPNMVALCAGVADAAGAAVAGFRFR